MDDYSKGMLQTQIATSFSPLSFNGGFENKFPVVRDFSSPSFPSPYQFVSFESSIPEHYHGESGKQNVGTQTEFKGENKGFQCQTSIPSENWGKSFYYPCPTPNIFTPWNRVQSPVGFNGNLKQRQIVPYRQPKMKKIDKLKLCWKMLKRLIF
jgi:hypothetical protein